MIDRERFEQLAALSAADEASPKERDELAAMVAQQPDLAGEIAEMESTDRLLRRAVQMREVEPMPPGVLERLEQTRREALSARLAEEAKQAGGAKVAAFPPAAPRRRSLPRWLALAAGVAAVAGLAVMFLRPRVPSSKDIAILGPRGETGFTQPLIVWDAKPDQRYDVWILPPEGSHLDAPALFVAKGVRPPVAFAELKPTPSLPEQSRPTTRLEPDTDYRLLVCFAEAGRVAGVAVPFHTAPDATKALPPPSRDAAKKLADAGRSSDALMLLSQLSPEERQRPEAVALERELRKRLSRGTSPAAQAP
ncbi:MAG: hypothetical protein QOE70_1033 [Chthoniobacter sp.]|jgi:hypothetical protein|nr:hypothetical protein [Chthoniobacter sp.]